MDWTLQRAAGQPNPTGFPWVKDAAMAIYAYENGLGFEPDRKSLTKAQRRAADARADYFVSKGRVWQKGRPIELDVPLLLFLIFLVLLILLLGHPLGLLLLLALHLLHAGDHPGGMSNIRRKKEGDKKITRKYF